MRRCLLLSIGALCSIFWVHSQAPGTKRWEFPSGTSGYASPAIGGDGTVYIGRFQGLGDSGGKLFALNPTTGIEKWEFNTTGGVYGSPAFGSDGVVYVAHAQGPSFGRLFAISGQNGSLLWSYTTPAGIQSSPALGNEGTVYFGCSDRKVYALSASSGAKRWEFLSGGVVLSSPAIGTNGSIFFGCDDGNLYCVDGQKGVLIWKSAVGIGGYASPAIGADGTVYCGGGKSILAINPSTGATKWSFLTGGGFFSSPALGSDGTVFMGGFDGILYALDGATGAKKWHFKTRGSIYSTPAVGNDGIVYCGSFDGHLYAVNSATGLEEWDYATGTGINSSPAISSIGAVLIGSDDGKLHAIASSSTGLAASSWPKIRGNYLNNGRAGGANSGGGRPSGPLQVSIRLVPEITVTGAIGATGLVQWSPTASGPWQTWTNVTLGASGISVVDLAVGSSMRFYRATGEQSRAGMAFIPGGTFTMGDSVDGEFGYKAVEATVAPFYMDTNLVSYAQWSTTLGYAIAHGYHFTNPGYGKGTDHPVVSVNWFDSVKWCNARSQQAGLLPVYYTDAALTRVYTNGEPATVYLNWALQGFRLPTEAEWEFAARGGLVGQRFPWGMTISESQANYQGDATGRYTYDLGPTGPNAMYANGTQPYTSPVGSFPSNGYGLFDMAGNAWEWCWDWFENSYAGGVNPRGPSVGTMRALRGGSWLHTAPNCRVDARNLSAPTIADMPNGFRTVIAIGQ